MKRIISVLLVLSALLVFSACGEKKDGEYSLSIGTALSEDIDELSVSATCAAVVTDGSGRVALCRLDCAETKATLTDKGVSGSVTEKTKYELGNSYGMKETGGAIAEWYEQARYFENYVKGKTLDEISAIHSGDSELEGGCTIDVSDFVRAIAAAMNSDKKIPFTPDGDMTAGLAISSSVTDNDGNAEFLNDSAATVICGNRVVAATVDSSEATITVKDGKGDSFIYGGTKLELGKNYGMVEKGGAIAEWYEQAKNYAATANGKTAEELSALPIENVSGCTIDAEPLKAVLVRAAKNER